MKLCRRASPPLRFQYNGAKSKHCTQKAALVNSQARDHRRCAPLVHGMAAALIASRSRPGQVRACLDHRSALTDRRGHEPNPVPAAHRTCYMKSECAAACRTARSGKPKRNIHKILFFPILCTNVSTFGCKAGSHITADGCWPCCIVFGDLDLGCFHVNVCNEGFDQQSSTPVGHQQRQCRLGDAGGY